MGPRTSAAGKKEKTEDSEPLAHRVTRDEGPPRDCEDPAGASCASAAATGRVAVPDPDVAAAGTSVMINAGAAPVLNLAGEPMADRLRRSGFDVSGLDPVPAGDAQQCGGPNALPFPDETFRAVFVGTEFQHAGPEMRREVWRVLGDGGGLVLVNDESTAMAPIGVGSAADPTNPMPGLTPLDTKGGSPAGGGPVPPTSPPDARRAFPGFGGDDGATKP